MSEYLTSLLHEMRNPWEYLGFLGQALFAGRFLVQWIATERAKRSVVPNMFWYLSIAATLFSLGYGLAMKRPAIIVANLFNIPVYLRNIWFVHTVAREGAGA